MRVAVVGAGIVGASVAYHLARRGAQTLLFDDPTPGQATAAGLGVVFPWAFPWSPQGWQVLAAPAAAHYPRLIDALRADGVDDHGYAAVGGYTVFDDPALATSMDQMMAGMREQPDNSGMGPTRPLAPGEPAERVGLLRPELSGYFVAGVARVDGGLLRDSLCRAAESHDAVARTGSIGLTRVGDRATITLDGEMLDVDEIVVAAGAWSTALCAPLGAALPVAPQRGMIVHLGLPEEEDTASWPVLRTMDEHWIVGFPGGRVAVGSTSDFVGFDHRVTAGGMHELLAAAVNVAPNLAAASVLETRIGFRPTSADDLPVFGRIPGLDRLVVATGLGGLGLTFGPYFGSLAADLILDEAIDLNLDPYCPDR